MASLSTIPDELVSQVLYHLSAIDSLTVQLLSRRFQSLANEPLLWRFYCQKFRFWNSEHGFKEKLGGRAADTDWKQLWLLRQRRNARIARLLDGLMASQVGRIRKFEQIGALGLDAKDFLMQQSALGDDEAEDALARR
jgi:F-box protein 21